MSAIRAVKMFEILLHGKLKLCQMSAEKPNKGAAMSDSPMNDDHGLDFDKADYSESSKSDCAQCGVPLASTYYTLNEHMFCERCQTAILAEGPKGWAMTRLMRAGLFGLVAAILGGGIWMLVAELTGYTLGIIAVAIGFLVGAAVKKGSHNLGGIGYQLMAVLLTYTAISMTYVPMMAEELRSGEFAEEFKEGVALGLEEEGEAGVPALSEEEAAINELGIYLFAILVSFTIPIFAGMESPIGLLIIGFALWEAGKMNRRVKLEFAGPFQLSNLSPPQEA